MSLTVCGGRGWWTRMVMACPTCQRRRRFAVYNDASPWYAPSVTCCACGDSWCESERAERPFRRGWRQESTARARRGWEQAVTRAEHRARLAESLAAA